MQRQIEKNYKTSWKRTAHISQKQSCNSHMTLRDVEKLRLWRLKIFRNQQPILRAKPPHASRKTQYLFQKIDNVKSQFGTDGKGDLLWQRDGMNPYHDLYDPGDLKTHRLSVTKLLTKSWCELRFAYDLYSRLPLFREAHLAAGERTHQKLENSEHTPVIRPQDIPQFSETVEIVEDDLHVLAASWAETITRLIHLFSSGDAREILCHGYLNKETNQLYDPMETEVWDPSQHILISGIIDHLTLTSKNGNLPLNNHHRSIDDSIAKLKNTRNEFAKNGLTIQISDVKTRTRKFIPPQESVQNATKLQLMYYRHFLLSLGTDSDNTYEMLLYNARIRGVDVDQPLNPANCLLIMIQMDGFVGDFVKLQNGDGFQFPKFDNAPISHSFTLADAKHHQFLQNINSHELAGQLLNGTFAKPITLRYFAMRLAQMYSMLTPLISEKLKVEYYHNNECFQEVEFVNDKKSLGESCRSASSFWFGKRAIEPVEATTFNYNQYCKHCDYRDHCAWIKDSLAKSTKLGDELTQIARRIHNI